MELEQKGDPSQLMNVHMSDPFDQVVIEKHIDNALLTSNRTVSGLNNTISQSLKIVHNKFTPAVINAGAEASQDFAVSQIPKDVTIQKIKRSYNTRHHLYPTSGQGGLEAAILAGYAGYYDH
jgi:hypothetical protein